MSREISEDFKAVIDFIKSYNLSGLASNPSFLPILSQQHKKYFSYLTCIAELIDLIKDANLEPHISQKQLDFIIESCSDIGSSIFVMTHGAYKASKMMLRSSIETFHKGYNLDELVDLDKEKSIYVLFEKVKSLPWYSSGLCKSIFDSIHQDYKILCQDTHTAANINMQHITALQYFPTFNLGEASQISETVARLVSNYNTLICLKYNGYFHKMHHRNKENIIENLPKKIRPLILGIKD
jgi:hypothetical protein